MHPVVLRLLRLLLLLLLLLYQPHGESICDLLTAVYGRQP